MVSDSLVKGEHEELFVGYEFFQTRWESVSERMLCVETSTNIAAPTYKPQRSNAKYVLVVEKLQIERANAHVLK
jgi:hypothetical protein